MSELLFAITKIFPSEIDKPDKFMQTASFDVDKYI
jgi:hypothetical protein